VLNWLLSEGGGRSTAADGRIGLNCGKYTPTAHVHGVPELWPQTGVFSSSKKYMSIESHGEMILKGENRRTLAKTCPSATLSIQNPTWTDPGTNSGLGGEKKATNRRIFIVVITFIIFSQILPMFLFFFPYLFHIFLFILFLFSAFLEVRTRHFSSS
jgi:hypothetical protein